MDVEENTWEFNCPQFVDFSNPDALPQADDEFFSAGKFNKSDLKVEITFGASSKNNFN